MNASVLEFLLTRRSVPARMMAGPLPSEDEVQQLLRAATRVPDHGKLEPFRLVVHGAEARTHLADLTRKLGAEKGMDPERLQKQAQAFEGEHLTISVLSTPVEGTKIPLVEQQMTAGAVCLSLVNAAQAMGYGGHWLSSWMALDKDFLRQAFDLSAPAMVAGFVHIGTTPVTPPERPRPDLEKIVTYQP